MKHHMLKNIDSEIFNLLQSEKTRQEEEINLIASENYAPKEILEATSSVLTNKYAEGYPGKRYYGGCYVADVVETIAIERCKSLFGSEHANVQPHSGSQANMALYATLLSPGDTILGMSLASGGHLTHGHPVNFSGVYYKSVQYGVDPKTELIDYEEIARLAEIHKPKLIIAGASAYSRIIDFKRIKEIAQSVDAYFAADIAHIAGLVATKLHPSPVGWADIVSSTTHKTLRGPRGGFLISNESFKDRIDRAVLPGMQGGPLMHVIAAKAVGFKLAAEPSFKAYQQVVIDNAQTLAQGFKEKGYRIVADGTDNHLFILDLRNKNVKGRTAESLLEKAGITVSRSCIPFDPEKPWVTSGIRLGTPAVSSRGMGKQEMNLLVDLIDTVLTRQDEATVSTIKEKTQSLCKEFPIYS